MEQNVPIARRRILKTTGSALVLGGMVGVAAADDDDGPELVEVDVREVGRCDYEVSWKVRAGDAELERLRLVLWGCEISGCSQMDRIEKDLSGTEASGEDRLRTSGRQLRTHDPRDVQVAVEDEAGNGDGDRIYVDC